MRRILLSVVIALLLPAFASAAHLVGGEITYECLGNGDYRIKLRIYRDCNSTGAGFDANAAVTIFNAQGNMVTNLAIPRGPIFPLPATVNNPCLQSPPNVCTEYADYEQVVNLPPIPGGYTITHQRCCRNNTISNIPTPGDWGNTYTISIPGNDNCNSAPEFTSEPPIVLCLDDPLNIDSSVLESDGDSIHYMLCSPLHGGGTDMPPSGSNCLTCPAPNPAGPPPYQNVPFSAPRTATNPIPSNPAVTIDPQTGVITGTPRQLGQYVFAVCVQEFRNGVLLSTVRRDYQFNVTNCSSNVQSDFLSQIQSGTICTGTTIAFEDESVNATTYSWDFGDPSTDGDTSHFQNPVYTYADTGTYTVTLIVNEGFPCADTSTQVFSVHYPVSFVVNYTGNTCFDIQNFVFDVVGDLSQNADYDWDFPPEANIQNHNTRSPPAITFNTPGTYWIELTVEDFGCSYTFGDSITVGLRPVFDATVPDQATCAPFTLDLRHSAVSDETVYYEWVFGDGTTSSAANPVHTYNNPGVYSGYLLMYTTRGCIDSARYDFSFEVFPSPDIDMRITPSKTDIFSPFVRIYIDNVDGNENYVVYTGDGQSFPNQSEIYHRYSDTGWYDISVIVENNFGCAVEIVIPFRVAPIPLIYTPDAFTPNGDGMNDRFRSFSSGYSEFSIHIFDRWGNLMFESYDAFEWWDGTTPDKEPAPQGTYVWIVKFRSTEGEYLERYGTVTLLR